MSLNKSGIRLGRVASPYGVKGWVKLVSFTQPRDNIFSYRHFFASRDGAQVALEMDAGKPQGKGLIAHFVGFDTPEAVRELTGLELSVSAEALPELGADDYYWHQLIGLQVLNRAGLNFGRVESLFETGANDVMVVEPDKDSIDDNQRLIPWLRDRVVIEVDLTIGRVVVDWEPDYLVD
ncbi:MAG: ribosome maturation factor RimM [Gammaproteobacteria bacterium]|nr:ribosome maturation factor RimM [Gammaproteobacteria bacterium]|tara:strand:- start:2437 stop:2973 length:537 start_codon:yes stop_codon:yes gene_type:complete